MPEAAARTAAAGAMHIYEPDVHIFKAIGNLALIVFLSGYFCEPDR